MLVFVSAAFSQLTPLKNTNQLNNSSTSESCGFDHVHNMLLNSNADYRQRTEDFNNFMKSYNAPKSGATYVVPVVVHVMHKGEAVGTGSNISEVDINQGILQLNERFRKIPGSLGDGNGVDVDIEFALAVRDPNGNCTNGIVRVDMTGNSTYMNFGVQAQTSNGITDAALKATSRWNTLEYYNIYLVSEIDDNECGFGIQGYAYFASAHGQSYDGMVQLGCKFAQSGNTTLTHELGHAMNLYHTFEGDNNGNSCPSNTSCSSQGDRCCDTPPHIRSASNCVTGTNSCDGGSSKELFIHNYMDYSSDACQSEFTADQKVRANAAISVTRASYLAANGNMALVPPSTAGVDFSVSSSVVCLGSPVTFYDESTCIPNTYQNGGWPNITFLWTFDDGINTPITSTDQNPTINFAQAGSYDVTLQITNGSGTTSLTKPGFVSVANGVQSSTCQNTSSNTGNFGYAISKVVFNTMSATSSSSTNGGWQDLTCSKNTQVTQGQNYNLEVTVNAGNSGLGLQFRVYIDYNDDGAYTAGELVLSNSITDNTSQTFTTSVNIPLTSTTGQLLRLRAISDGGTLGGGCESPLLVGDVEDYGVYINPSGVPPVAEFSGTPTTLCEGNTVSFTDLSTNTPTSWSWTFTGGTPSSSTAQNPTITYNTAGTYQVQLTATNAFGNDIETKVGYITVNACGVTKLINSDCGKIMTTYLDYVTCDYVAGATEYEYEISNVGLSYNQTVIRNYKWRFIYLYEIPGIQNNTTYNIRVRAKVGGIYSSYGTVCQLTTPISSVTTNLIQNDCGINMTSYNNYITCEYVSSATEYEYEFVNTGLSYTQTIVRSNPKYRFVYVHEVPGIQLNTTYDVRVRAKINGVYTSYGSVCQITIPSNPITTQLRSSDCGIIMSSYSNYITCDYVANATEYEYEFVNTGLSYTQTYLRTNPNYRFVYVNNVPGIQLSTTYDVRVRAKVNGVFTQYGTICQITTPPSARYGIIENEEVVIYNDELANDIRLTIYPNPSQGEFVYMELKSSEDISELIVTDITGKIVHQQNLQTDDYYSTVRFNEKLNPGFYFVTVVSGSQKQTKKLVVK